MVPDLPPFTCPLIDEVIDFIKDLSALYEKADAVIATMEDLRQANSDLRERQSHFEEENHNYEAKIEELEDLVSELRNQE